MKECNIKAYAFYLPQYHPIKENNKWWGAGFTEWTNVGKAKKYYKDHYQPKVPADLGYYDLRLEETRILQADMARRYGIDGFCYYHYWFGGHQLLERPFNEVLNSGSPDFPFMLCWANESWHSKFWNNDGTISKELLIEQKYDDKEDVIRHFNYVLTAFRDPRYIKIDGKPAFVIYLPDDFPDVKNFIQQWQELARQNGLDGIFFIGQTSLPESQYEKFKNQGFDAINTTRLRDVLQKRSSYTKTISRVKRTIFNQPIIIDYKEASLNFVKKLEYEDDVFPSTFPNWDHTPRSGRAGLVLQNSDPQKFGKHLKQVFECISKKPLNRQICFIKSWNEWGEGNYMEPDLKFGTAYLKEFLRVKKKFY